MVRRRAKAARKPEGGGGGGEGEGARNLRRGRRDGGVRGAVRRTRDRTRGTARARRRGARGGGEGDRRDRKPHADDDESCSRKSRGCEIAPRDGRRRTRASRSTRTFEGSRLFDPRRVRRVRRHPVSRPFRRASRRYFGRFAARVSFPPRLLPRPLLSRRSSRVLSSPPGAVATVRVLF